jgi:hypothetical protein
MNKSIRGNTFADCYRDLLHNLLEKPEYVCAPRGMQINEITDLSFTIENPQSCLYDNKRRGRGGRIYTKTHIAKNSFFNPIKQNLIHVNAIKQSIQSVQTLPLFNVVVFMNRGNISNVEMKDGSSYVINRRHLSRLVKQKEKELKIQPVDLLSIQDEFTKKNTFSKANLKKHIRKIKEKYNKS